MSYTFTFTDGSELTLQSKHCDAIRFSVQIMRERIEVYESIIDTLTNTISMGIPTRHRQALSNLTTVKTIATILKTCNESSLPNALGKIVRDKPKYVLVLFGIIIQTMDIPMNEYLEFVESEKDDMDDGEYLDLMNMVKGMYDLYEQVKDIVAIGDMV